MYIIYGKLKTESRYKAMDMENGCQVGNLIYASLFNQPKEVMDQIVDSLNKDNPEWDFKYKHTN